MQNDYRTAIYNLKSGNPPGNSDIIKQISVGINFVTDFWREQYLQQYINLGGSKIKFLTGNPGSGKTHFLELFMTDAVENNYLTVTFSAKKTWIHDFKEIYIDILKKVDLIACLEQCAAKIIKELGFDSDKIPEDMTFIDYLSTENMLDPIIKREIRIQLNKMFLQNPLVDNNFALCCSLLTGGILGHPMLEEHNKKLLLLWLESSREVKLSAVRPLGLSPGKITRYNARHMLRSLIEMIKIAGYSGLIVGIDDVEALVSNSSLEDIRYTKMRREDAYENIRELIDEIDTLKNIMFIFSFERKLIDDENHGLKSYQALWMRIQNEVEGNRFNRFTDIIDLDKLARQEYTPDILVEMSNRLAAVLSKQDDEIYPINEEEARKFISHIQYGQVSLPRQINCATQGKKVEVNVE